MDDLSRTVSVRHESTGWPQLWEPLRHLGTSIAHLFSPSADASFDDGVLKVALPKLQSSNAEERRIEIRKR